MSGRAKERLSRERRLDCTSSRNGRRPLSWSKPRYARAVRIVASRAARCITLHTTSRRATRHQFTSRMTEPEGFCVDTMLEAALSGRPEPYFVMPCTFEAGVMMRFTLNVYSSKPIELEVDDGQPKNSPKQSQRGEAGFRDKGSRVDKETLRANSPEFHEDNGLNRPIREEGEEEDEDDVLLAQFF